MLGRATSLLVVLGCLAGRGASAQGFARAVAAGAGEVFVGEPETPYAKGTVYVYRANGGTDRKEIARLQAANGTVGDQFGSSLSLDGARLLVGAPFANGRNGAAYVFERDRTGTWRESATLVPPMARPLDMWGWNVLLAGDVAYVGSFRSNEGQGAVVVYRRAAAGRWIEEATLRPSVPARYSFATALDADENRLLVGAPRTDSSSGTAYLFRRDPASGRWSEEVRLPVVRLPGPARFGAAVLLRGDEALISAPGVNGGTGAIAVFRRDPTTGRWTQPFWLRPSDGIAKDRFGTSLAFVAPEVWVGAPGADSGRGRVVRLTRDPSGGWTPAGRIGHPPLDRDDGFGGAVSGSPSGAAAVVGMPDDDFGAGTAVILTRSGETWTAGPKRWPATTGLDPVVGKKRECANGKVGPFPCGGVDLLAFLPVSALGGARGVQLSGNWGWTDSLTGREYALVGKVDGTAFVDVTDPATPVYLGSLPKSAAAQASIWRELKVYRNHAFIVSDNAGPHGMQVFDLTRLRNLTERPVVFTEDAIYGGIESAHNVVIDTSSGFAYAVGSNGGAETCGGALHMIDIREPKQPKFAGCFADPSTGYNRDGYIHDAQCVVYHGPDQAYGGRQICFNSSETALGIADVTDKANPKRIAAAAYPNVAYVHQGWLTDDHRYFYLDDEGDEIAGLVPGTRTLIWDVSDLDEPVMVAEYIAESKATDHNLYIQGNLMYQSNYLSGLRVYDITNRLKPLLVGFFDTVPFGDDGPEMNGAWNNYPFFRSGTIVVNSMQEGLFVLRTSDRRLVP